MPAALPLQGGGIGRAPRGARFRRRDRPSLSTLRRVVSVEPLEVQVAGGRRRAWADRQLLGEMCAGDEVVVNVAALDLGLGSGGFDVDFCGFEFLVDQLDLVLRNDRISRRFPPNPEGRLPVTQDFKERVTSTALKRGSALAPAPPAASSSSLRAPPLW